MPLVAVKTIGYSPPLPVIGEPLRLAVPSRLFCKLTPEGKMPVVLNEGAGNPLLVKVNVLNVPDTKEVLVALVIVGGCPMVTISVWVASGDIPFLAVKLTV